MTSPAIVKQSDLKRMAAIAKSENVMVTIEVDGRKISVSPNIPDNHRPEKARQEWDINL